MSDIGFEFGNDSAPNDVFTAFGTGQDLDGSNDGFADTFEILEPIPPNDALTSPGPGFTFDGGEAVYTNNTTSTDPQAGVYQDGQQWYVKYSYTSTLDSNSGGGGPGSGLRSFVPVPAPGISARRIKIAENFSPEVRDRFFLNYSFFNDSFGGLGDISRYIMGFERILVDDLVSLEVRLPMAATYGSFQQLDRAENRNFELGNMSLSVRESCCGLNHSCSVAALASRSPLPTIQVWRSVIERFSGSRTSPYTCFRSSQRCTDSTRRRRSKITCRLT